MLCGATDVPEIKHDGPGPEAAAVASSGKTQIDLCLDELSDRHRFAIRGAYLEGWTYRELAERLDVPLNTIRTWLRRSLIRLKNVWR